MTTTPTPSEMTWRDFLLSKGAQFKVLATGKVGTFQGFLVRKIAQLPVNIIVDGEYYLENQVELLDSKKLKDEYHGVSTPSDAREELRDKVANLLADDYACTRVWEAWQVGTMTQDDFEPLSETERADEIVALFDTLLAEKVREAEIERVGDAIEIEVPIETMQFVLSKIKVKNETIAKRTLKPLWLIEKWRSGEADKYDLQVEMWVLKILASLTTKYNWAVFLIKPENLAHLKGASK